MFIPYLSTVVALSGQIEKPFRRRGKMKQVTPASDRTYQGVLPCIGFTAALKVSVQCA